MALRAICKFTDRLVRLRKVYIWPEAQLRAIYLPRSHQWRVPSYVYLACFFPSGRFSYQIGSESKKQSLCVWNRASHLGFSFDKYFSKLFTGHILPPVSYILTFLS